MKKQHVTLSESDKQYLLDLLHQSSLTRKHFQRATALLELDKGATFLAVASLVETTHHTVSTWSKKYKENGLDFLTDKKRSGRPPEITGLQRAKITALACSRPPEGYKRWTLRLLSDKLIELDYVEQISHNQVGLILKKMSLNLIDSATGALEQ